jgi:D-glycero-alpha-D-manno-heptose-7-phosphate kinase
VRTVAEIRHPAVRAVLSEMELEHGVEIHHDGDLPARSGLGSSSSFTVGLVNAVNALRGRMSTKRWLAEQAIHIERHVLRETVGLQDQVWAAYGGFNRIDFGTDESITVKALVLPSERRRALTDHLLLFFTGFSRFASEVARHQIDNLEQRRAELHEIRAMVDEGEAILCNPEVDLRGIGELLHQGWMRKRTLSSMVSTSAIDGIYETGRRAGAIGGKLLGAGGGGFMLFFVEPDKRAAVRAALSDLIEVDIDIDRVGSDVVLYEPNGFRSG